MPNAVNPRITIALTALNKTPVKHTFNHNETIKVVLKEGVNLLHLDKNPPQPYEIYLVENGRPGRKLQLDATLEGEGIKEGDTLIIVAPPSPDG